jgi:tRNA (mo5U34)-methyltransferase
MVHAASSEGAFSRPDRWDSLASRSMSRTPGIRRRLAALLPRGRTLRLGRVSVRHQWDGLLIGPAVAHPLYGRSYTVEPLPADQTPEDLQRFVGRTSWSHEIDLGHGVSTKPAVKSRDVLADDWKLFGLGDITGKSVLDIGGIDGGYAFLAERSGGDPVAVLDHYIWALDSEAYSRIYNDSIQAGTTPPAPHESAAWNPDAMPTLWRFDTAKQALNSRVSAIPLDFMDCNLAEVGAWDITLYLGVLYHMPDPVGALRRVSAITKEQCIIETEAMYIPGHPEALWRFFPAGELNNDATNWWVPNISALVGIATAAGFNSVEVLRGEPAPDEDSSDPSPRHYRAVVRACKKREV